MYTPFKRSRRKFLFLLLAGIVGIVGIIAGLRYRQSSEFIAQGDTLLQEGKSEEAVLTYLKAYDLFPLRPDVTQKLRGARLILESDLGYKSIYQIGEQIQEVPQVPAIPTLPVLQAGQLRVPILMYHHIRVNPKPNDPVWAALNVTPQQLDDQLNYLMTHNYHTITLDQLWDALNNKATLPENPIILTFDDGYRNFYDAAFPILKKYQVKAVAFVITAVVNSPAYLTWDQIAEMDKSGLVQFGAHTRHHPNLPDLSAAIIADEIKGSKIDLETHLKKPILWFCYPYGSYSNNIIVTVKQAGFIGAASTIYGTVQSKDTIYLMPRIMVDGRFSLDNLARRIAY